MKKQDITISTKSPTLRNTRLTKFKSNELNELGAKLIELDQQYVNFMRVAERNLYSAFETRWLYGKYISENYGLIIDECGTQKEFASTMGQSEAVISNNKRAYENLLEEGCESFDGVKQLLTQKSIKPTIRNFEKIGTLLNEPEQDTKQIDQIEKDRRRLEELRSELEDILKRNEPANNPELYTDALEFIEDVDDIKDYLQSFDPLKSKFKSEKYLNFVRNFGVDLITMEPCEKCDPHHTTPKGGSGSMGETLPDFFAIPVSRITHRLIEGGLMKPSSEEILRAQFTTLTAFITACQKKK